MNVVLVAVAVLVVDRVTKELALRRRGAVLTAHPLLAGGASLRAEVALWLAAAACAVGALLFAPALQHNMFVAAGVAAALAGALGNLTDRLIHGAVVDFVSLGWWPVFNLADVAIVGGAAIAGAALI
jgi:lipoprotein signal peptidase